VRKREHEAILAAHQAGHDLQVTAMRERIIYLEVQNEDLLNRCMSKDWSQYTALSAEPYNPPDPGEWIFDATGLVSVEREGEPGSL